MKVGFHAPLPPARTGVADYAAALMGALGRFGAVEAGAGLADVHLYHLGNNQLHRAIYRRAMERPGVVVLHDAVLHHFFLGWLDRERYIEEFVYNYGEWNRGLAEELWRGRGSALADPYFRRPMLRRVVERARAIVVHNPAAARMAREHGGREVVEIPHLFAPPALPPPVPLGRGPLFGVFGYLRESKRLLTVLRVFRGPGALLVAGRFVSRDLERAAGPWLARPGVIRAPFLSERDFWRYAAAVDACINLRYPAAGETSGISIRLMGIGKPVILSDTAENAAYPEAACLRIPTGLEEEESLRAHMILLTSMAQTARRIGHYAAEHIARHHALEQAAARYWEVLCRYKG